MLVRSGECERCGKCCETVNLTVVRDVALQQHGNLEELKLYLSYRGIQVAGEDVENNFLFYSISIPCRQLNEDKSCRVHETPDKPLLCLRYPKEKADVADIEECSYSFKPAGLAYLPQGVPDPSAR